jgi:hypothetical protein
MPNGTACATGWGAPPRAEARFLAGRYHGPAQCGALRRIAAQLITHNTGAGRRHTMKLQVSRLSPHQNGKVFGVLMAVVCLVFLVPVLLMVTSVAPPGNRGPMLIMFFFMPLVYLVFGYLMTVVGCALYNFMFKYVGGIEYEAKSEETA